MHLSPGGGAPLFTHENMDETRVGLDFVTILNRILKLNFQFLILNKVSDFNCGGPGS